jgi:hypothetical protein
MNFTASQIPERAPFLKFDTSKYKMKSLNFDYEGTQYKEKFYENLGVNKKHIN